MIIVSQNKKTFVNFDVVASIEIRQVVITEFDNKRTEWWEIRAMCPAVSEQNVLDIILGTFDEEEHCKKVFEVLMHQIAEGYNRIVWI